MRTVKAMRNKYREVLRANDIADELGVGLSTVWLWAKKGKITPIKMTERVTVFSIDELNNVLGCNLQKEIKVENHGFK